LFKRTCEIIEIRKRRAGSFANSEIILMYWEIGQYISSAILDFKRAEYGKQIFSTLSRNLVATYGRPFQEENLYRMAQFANTFLLKMAQPIRTF
jgi:hypothetical protein